MSTTGGLFSNFPSRENIVDGPSNKQSPWLMSFRWLQFMRELTKAVNSNVRVISSVALTAQGASIVTTPFDTPALAAGLYRVTWYQRVTSAAGTSSSLTTTLSWTDGAVACSFSGAAMTGNTTSTVQSQTFMMNIDQSSPISYATTYASNTAGAMKYSLNLELETVDA